MARSSTLTQVNTDILKKALEVIALELGIKVRDYIEDYYGSKHYTWSGNKIIGSLFTKELTRGIGVTVDKEGKLAFVGNSDGCKEDFNKMKDKIEFTYKVIALVIAAQESGCEVTVTQNNDVTVIEAVQ